MIQSQRFRRQETQWKTKIYFPTAALQRQTDLHAQCLRGTQVQHYLLRLVHVEPTSQKRNILLGSSRRAASYSAIVTPDRGITVHPPTRDHTRLVHFDNLVCQCVAK